MIAQAIDYVKAGIYTGASTRNWAGFGAEVRLAEGMAEWQKQVLTDPQTSGGLLVACAPESEAEVMALFARGGFADARKIGSFVEGSGLSVR